MHLPSRKLIIPMAALAIAGAGVYGIGQVAAASANADSAHTTLVQRVADTFHLDKAKVQAVFDQVHEERRAERQVAFEERLAQAVKDGKLTGAQKDAILAEHDKLKAEMDAARDKTGADHRAAMDNIRAEAETWLSSNAYAKGWLMMPRLHHGGAPADGIGHGGRPGMMADVN